MHRIELIFDRRELSDKMAEMRIWLDARRCEPSKFSTHGAGSAILVKLAFHDAEAAVAFAEQFGGRMAAAA